MAMDGAHLGVVQLPDKRCSTATSPGRVGGLTFVCAIGRHIRRLASRPIRPSEVRIDRRSRGRSRRTSGCWRAICRRLKRCRSGDASMKPCTKVVGRCCGLCGLRMVRGIWRTARATGEMRVWWTMGFVLAHVNRVGGWQWRRLSAVLCNFCVV